MPELRRIREKYPEVLSCLLGKGLAAGVQVVRPGTKSPDPDTALRINIACFPKGPVVFAPVAADGECLKTAPPLTITEDTLRESLKVFEEAIYEVLQPAVKGKAGGS
jgi:4-aminobutyrate aminotransferase/(S)-3-amino-2-methylpropionate transaminase